jgi:hypothetical protein
MSDLVAKLRVLLTALPTWLAAATAVLTVVSIHVVPNLPGGLPVEVGGWVATGLAIVRTVGEVVARLTPVEPEDRGVLPTG